MYRQTNTNKQVCPNCGRENSESHMLECLCSFDADVIDTCLNFRETLENRKEAALKLNEWVKEERKLKRIQKQRAAHLVKNTPVSFWSKIDDKFCEGYVYEDYTPTLVFLTCPENGICLKNFNSIEESRRGHLFIPMMRERSPQPEVAANGESYGTQ